MKHKKIITIVVFLIILICLGYIVGVEINRWWEVRKEYIEMGFASDKFPFRMYTERELVEMGRWPVESEYYDSISTRTTPEETYAKFREALIDEDFETAAECFIEKKREEIRKNLKDAKEENRLQEIINLLKEIHPEGEKIEKGDPGSLATYELLYEENGKVISHPILFFKDKNGDWLMENL